MSWLTPSSASSLLLASGIVVFAMWLWRRMAEVRHLPYRRGLWFLSLGAVAALVALFLERWALSFAGVSLQVGEQQALVAALAMLLFCAPLEEGLKAAAVWPLYVGRRLVTGQLGAIYAVVVAAGFSAVEVIFFTFEHGGSWLSLIRVAFAAPAHLFFAGLWGFMLGGVRRDRYFSLVWLLAVAFHGVYDHIVFGRAPAHLVIVVPMLALMGVGVFALLRDRSEAHSSRRTAYSLFDAPSVSSVRGALSRRGRRLMVHWIVIGAFVNLGVIFVFLAATVYWGHHYGVDFSLADEEGLAGILPLALLGGALLAAFPVSAYMVARASRAVSVLEPAWATGASIFVVLGLFSVTEPTALVIAVGVAPVGFILACAGAWFGLDRR